MTAKFAVSGTAFLEAADEILNAVVHIIIDNRCHLSFKGTGNPAHTLGDHGIIFWGVTK